MTVEEAAQKIKDYIISQGGSGVSFVELARVLGEDGKGDQWMGLKTYNIWWWFGMSDLFIDALELLRPEIEPTPTHLLVYLCDGGYADLPIAKKARCYKKPHWAPICWGLRKTPLEERKQDK